MFIVLTNSAPYYSMYDNEIQLRDNLIEYLDTYREVYRELYRDYVNIDYRKMSFNEIVLFAIKIGQLVINENMNYGIIQIIKGMPFEHLPELQMNNIDSVFATPISSPIILQSHEMEYVDSGIVILQSREMDETEF